MRRASLLPRISCHLKLSLLLSIYGVLSLGTSASACLPDLAQAIPLAQGDVIARGLLGHHSGWNLGAQGRLGLSDRGLLQLSIGSCSVEELWGPAASLGVQYQLLTRADLADLALLSAGIDALSFYGSEVDEEGGEASSISLQGFRWKLLFGERWALSESRGLRATLSLGFTTLFEDEQRTSTLASEEIPRSELLWSPSVALSGSVDVTATLPLDIELRYERDLFSVGIGFGHSF